MTSRRSRYRALSFLAAIDAQDNLLSEEQSAAVLDIFSQLDRGGDFADPLAPLPDPDDPGTDDFTKDIIRVLTVLMGFDQMISDQAVEQNFPRPSIFTVLAGPHIKSTQEAAYKYLPTSSALLLYQPSYNRSGEQEIWESFWSQMYTMSPTRMLLQATVSGLILLPKQISSDFPKCFRGLVTKGILDLGSDDQNRSIEAATAKERGSIKLGGVETVYKRKIVQVLEVFDVLSRLSRSPVAVPIAFSKNYLSTFTISRDTAENFSAALTMPSDQEPIYKDELSITPEAIAQAASNMYINASSYAARNSYHGVRIIQDAQGPGVSLDPIQKRNIPLDITLAVKGITEKTQAGPIPLAYENLFGSHMTSTCAHGCNSVISPTAYFVDLLQFLRYTKTDPTGSIDDKAYSLLTHFQARRPDILDLELSCENALLTIPYIDLVNEVLESWISSRKAKSDSPDPGDGDEGSTNQARPLISTAIRPQNNNPGNTSESLAVKPLQVDYNLYSDPIGNRVYPLNTFPYSLSMDTVRTVLQAMSATRFEILEALSLQFDPTDNDIAESPDDEEHPTASSRAAALVVSSTGAFLPKARLERSHVANIEKSIRFPLSKIEYGGNLEASDDSGLNGDTMTRAFVSEKFGLLEPDFVAISGEYFTSGSNASNGDDSTYQRHPIWSYWGYDSEESMMDSNLDKGQGLSFVKEQLLRRAEITLPQLVEFLKTRYFRAIGSDDSNPRRIVMDVPEDGDFRKVQLRFDDNSSLEAAHWDKVQRFIRLWKKIGFEIAQLDACIQIAVGTDSGITNSQLTPETLVQLHLISSVHELTDLGLTDVISLWDNETLEDILKGPLVDSILKRIANSPTDSAESGTETVTTDFTAGDAVIIVLVATALQTTAEQIKAVLNVLVTTGIKSETRINGKEDLHHIYRYILACRALSIAPSDLPVLQQTQFFSSNGWILKSPTQAFTCLKKWRSIQSCGFSIQNLRSLSFTSTAEPNDATDTDSGTDNQNLKNLLPDVERKLTQSIKILDSIHKARGEISRKYQVLSEASTEDVERISAPLFSKDIIAKIVNFLEAPRDNKDEAPSDGNDSGQDVADRDSFYDTVLADILGTSSAAKADLLTTPNSVDLRRLTFYNAMRDYLLKQEDEVTLLKILSSQKFGGTTGEMIRLLAKVLWIQPAKSDKINILQSLSDELLQSIQAKSVEGPSFEGFFRPLSSDTYRFIAEEPNFEIIVNGIQYSLEPKADGTPKITVGVDLKSDTFYKIYLHGSIGSLKWRGLRTENEDFTKTAQVFNVDVQQYVERTVLAKLEEAASVVGRLKLSPFEVNIIQNDEARWKNVDFSSLTAAGLSDLIDYCELKKSLKKSRPDVDLLEMFQEVDKNPSAEKSKLFELLSSATGWSVKWISEFVIHYGNGVDIPLLITTVKVLKRMDAIMQVLAKLRHWDIGIDTLQLISSSKSEDIDQASIQLEQIYDSRTPQESWIRTAGPKVYDILRNNRRNVLIRYLLEEPEIKSQNLKDADNIFEYFMIDVQMGLALQTSRIRQAVSAIQLFVQRCLLGLEIENGVPQNAIDHDRWNWMRRFNLWEANRRIFLYPENWIDPSLRDNKTDLFAKLESELQQKSLSYEEIKNALSTYISSAYELRSLAIQGVHKEYAQPIENQGETPELSVLHIFGRTLAAPYIYYHRRWLKAGSVWTPWTKIDVDIVTHELNPLGDPSATQLDEPSAFLVPVVWDQRLLLFLPVFRSCVVQVPSASDYTPEQIGKQKVSKTKVAAYYEIRIGWTEYRGGKWTPLQYNSTRIISNSDENDYVGKKPPAKWDFEVNWRNPEDLVKYNFEVGASLPSLEEYLFSTKTVEVPGLVDGTKDRALVLTVFRYRNTPGGLPAYTAIQTLRMIGGQLVPDTTTGSASEDDTPSDSQTPPDLAPFSRLHVLGESETAIVAYQDSTYDSNLIRVPDESNSLHLSRFTVKIGEGYVDQLYHELAPALQQATKQTDLEKIFQVYTDNWGNISPDEYGNRTGELTFNEGRTPSAIYNWEVAVHAPMLLMDRLLKSQQFDLALQVAKYIFNPFAADKGNDLASCWNWPGFSALSANQAMASALGNFDSSDVERVEFMRAVEEWRDKPFQPYLVARGRTIAYMKWVVVKYLEILVAYGDYYFRQASFDALPSATQLYVQAAHIFGKPEAPSTQMASMQLQTYNSLAEEKDGEGGFDAFSDSIVKMEYQWPFRKSIQMLPNIGDGSSIGLETVHSLMSLASTRYFSVPLNPKLKDIGNVIKDRLFKIRSSLDINGNPLRIPLFDPPIEPGLLVSAVAQSGLGGIDSVISGLERPMPNYRFLFVLQKAMELCQEVKSTAASYLAAREKKDAESMALLRSRQDMAISNFSIRLKEMELEEANKTLKILEDSLNSPKLKMKYYLQLIGESQDRIPTAEKAYSEVPIEVDSPIGELKMNQNEALEIAMSLAAEALTTSASVDELYAAAFKLLPAVQANMQPLGTGISTTFDPKLAGGVLKIGAGVKRLIASVSNYIGNRHARISQFKGQLQERKLQVNQAGYEIQNLELHIDAQKHRIEMAQKQLDISRIQMENAREVDETMRTKFTNQELYSWMESMLQESLYQSYSMAFDMAKAAEKTYHFERGDDSISFFKQNYWNSSRAGIGSAEDLYYSLKQMELAYMMKRDHDYEITKSFSLRRISPSEFLRFRETGQATLDIPEYLFDLDFPGHYFRRIKSVSLTIPCLLGPYMSVNCVLRLMEHKYRADSSVVENYLQSKKEPDSRFKTTQVPIQSIATSNGQNDSGVFELVLKDERYIPFEGAGVISKWTIELPNEYRQFNYESISDLVLNIKYTAKDGGGGLRKAATDSLKNILGEQTEGTLHLLIDLAADFPSDWYRFIKDAQTTERKIVLKDLERWLPYFAVTKGATANRIQLQTKSQSLKLHIVESDEASDTSGAEELMKGSPQGRLIDYNSSSTDLSFGFTTWTLFAEGEFTPDDKPMLLIDYFLKDESV